MPTKLGIFQISDTPGPKDLPSLTQNKLFQTRFHRSGRFQQNLRRFFWETNLGQRNISLVLPPPLSSSAEAPLVLSHGLPSSSRPRQNTPTLSNSLLHRKGLFVLLIKNNNIFRRKQQNIGLALQKGLYYHTLKVDSYEGTLFAYFACKQNNKYCFINQGNNVTLLRFNPSSHNHLQHIRFTDQCSACSHLRN